MARYVAKTHLTALKHLYQDLKGLTALATPENPGDVADLLGEIRHLETLLAEWRRGLMAETEDAKGEEFEIVTRRKAKRSFNLSRILYDLGKAAGLDTFEMIMDLQTRKALTLSVRWTDMKKAFEFFDVPLVTQSREIEDDGDLEAPHVGELWTEYTVNVPVKKEG